jgi:hypothetical protein
VLSGLVALVVLVVALFAAERESVARLHPYYVIRTAAYGQVSPRVLFVLDTSGSMGFRANADNVVCRWDECENPAMANTEFESRIASARRAIDNVVAATSDRAQYALMTFEQRLPRSGGSNPSKCDPGTDQERRFAWVSEYEYSAGAGALGPIQRDPGYDGALRLCQGSTIRPYPYLRWDDLGTGSVITANNQIGDPPPSPLVSTLQADRLSLENAQRKVQWFPYFMGVRVHLDDTNDPTHAITYATVGDQGTNDTQKDNKVRGHDYYYWPYVDGFPGYANWHVSPDSTGLSAAGVTGEDPALARAQLYAPFYLDLSASAVPSSAWGPASEAEALAALQVYTGPITEGGLDVAGGTPWSDAIGDVVASAPASNAQFSHTSVASYLSFIRDNLAEDVCAPTVAVLVTDGYPSSGQGGDALYARLADLRNELGVKTYVVGFFLDGDALNDMACAAAGACDGGLCSSPCDDTPANDWDTCADVDDPDGECAFVVESTSELEIALTHILDRTSQIDVASGPSATVNEFGVTEDGDAGEGQVLQTTVRAYTEYPGWEGHVVRRVCDDVDGTGTLQPYCTSPNPEFIASEAEETFGPCPQSRNWDAGECLQQTVWTDRRIYTNTAANDVIAIAEADGTASSAFKAELELLGLLTSADHDAEANAIVAFVLGRDAPNGWKLPGLANSAPVVVRRIPPYKSENLPEVNIRDPHCAGRLYGDLVAGSLPTSLRQFALTSDTTILDSPTPHHEYLEAVMVGDDMGVLHAFQLDSGNELWGFLPRAALTNTIAQAANGPADMGQPEDLEDHIHGIAATVTQGYAYTDDATPRWVHLGVFGMGEGGSDYYALDLSHMSPSSPDGPIEILWSSEDPAIKADYDDMNGETWARPALSYRVQNDSLAFEPDAYLVMGSGYPVDDPAPAGQGRTLVLANATTGAIVESAQLPVVTEPVYEPSFGAVVDPAVGSHCLSRFWAEMQETYIADPAGRLFRWDLGAGTNHEADSVTPWGANAQQVYRFPACEGAGDDCAVAAGNRGDPFLFGPAVSASNRIDDFTAIQAGSINDEVDHFLIALASGSPNDDTLDPSLEGNTFHSSIYLLVDDHRSGDKGLGFVIPAGAPKLGDVSPGSSLGTEQQYMRLALSDIVRVRTVTPYDGATPFVETRNFSRSTRPVRAPRILVTGVADAANPDQVIEGIEVYYATYTVFEPGSFECDPRFYDPVNEEWHPDLGSTYEITLRVTADAATGFNFTTGSQSPDAAFAAGFQPGLTFESVQQVNDDDCPGGNCGAVPDGTGTPVPCDNNANGAGGGAGTPTGFALATNQAQISGFTPVE